MLNSVTQGFQTEVSIFPLVPESWGLGKSSVQLEAHATGVTDHIVCLYLEF